MPKAFDLERKRVVRATTERSLPRKKSLGLGGVAILAVITYAFLAGAGSGSPKSTAQPPTQPSIPITTQPSQSPSISFGPTSPAPTPTETPVITPSPISTPSPSPITEAPLDKATITMHVLNGSGTAGSANTLRTKLIQKGFHVRTIGTAKTVRAKTTIFYAPDKKTAAELVRDAITPTPALEENGALASPDDLVIVVGKS